MTKFTAKAQLLTGLIEGHAWDDDMRFTQKTKPMIEAALLESYEQGREDQRRKDVDILHNEGGEPDVSDWLAAQPKDVPNATVKESK